MERHGKGNVVEPIIQERLLHVAPLIHEVAAAVYRHRKTSPLSLPLQNFKSRLSRDLVQYWYAGTELQTIKNSLQRMGQRFRQDHTKHSGQHHDDRSLIFSPAKDTECHGQPHPTGNRDRCFVSGRFRFGAALFPGFHYDVRSANGRLECVLYDCDGVARDVTPERRAYINIFPNDHLLPAVK